MSKHKPFHRDAGYKCSLRAPFGHVVVYDRSRGGDWIDADTRWVAAAYDHELRNTALLECRTERIARKTMKAARDGDHDWIQTPTATTPSPDIPQPSMPDNPSYMRGWNAADAAFKHHRPKPHRS